MDRQRRLILQLGVGVGAGVGLNAAALTMARRAHAAVPAPLPTTPKGTPAPMDTLDDGRHDFDFYFGRWQVHNRRLAKRLAGSNDWIEFDATDECRPVLGGLGSVDHYRT